MSDTSFKTGPGRKFTGLRLVGLVLIVVGMGLAIWLGCAFAREPSYMNKRVSTWINELHFTELGDPNPTLYALIQMGPDAVPYLTQRLRWRDSNKYYVAFYSKLPQPAPRLLLRPHTEQDRWLAAWALAQFGLLAQGAMPDLIHALHDPSPSVRERAAEAMALLGPARKNALPALIEALNDPDEQVQGAVTSAIASLGPEAEAAVPALTARLQGTNEPARLAIEALGKIGPAAASAVPSLLELLHTSDSSRRALVMDYLGPMGPAANIAVPVLRKALGEPNHEIHTHAANALGLIGGRDAETLQRLKEALGDAQCRKAVARALWRLDPKLAKGVAPKLVDSLDQWPPPSGTQPFVWPPGAAAQSSLSYEDWTILSELGPAVKDAFPDFSPLLAHTNALTRVLAATAVWHAERDAGKVRSVLAVEINNTNAAVKKWAALGLWRVEPDSPLVIPALVSLIEDKEGNVSGTVCSSLAQFGEKAKPTVPAVLRALRHEHWFTRRMATWTLMRIDPATAANVGMNRP